MYFTPLCALANFLGSAMHLPWVNLHVSTDQRHSHARQCVSTISDTITVIGTDYSSTKPSLSSLSMWWPFSMSCHVVISIRTIIDDHNHNQWHYHCNWQDIPMLSAYMDISNSSIIWILTGSKKTQQWIVILSPHLLVRKVSHFQ